MRSYLLPLRRWLAGLVGVTIPLWSSQAVEYRTVELEGKKAIVCEVKVAQEQLELFLTDDQNRPLKSFDGINKFLAEKGRRLSWGMNAGMYHGNLAPVGLYASSGRQLAPLNLADDQGNFFLKPNGVFYLSQRSAHVVESSEMLQVREPVEVATQSGPLLLRRGKIHPKFNPTSDSRLYRNGVGVPAADTALFAISTDLMNLHEFARLFRDVLKCPDALYLDGTVSSLYAPSLKRNDKIIDLGPIIGITEPLP